MLDRFAGATRRIAFKESPGVLTPMVGGDAVKTLHDVPLEFPPSGCWEIREWRSGVRWRATAKTCVDVSFYRVLDPKWPHCEYAILRDWHRRDDAGPYAILDSHHSGQPRPDSILERIYLSDRPCKHCQTLVMIAFHLWMNHVEATE